MGATHAKSAGGVDASGSEPKPETDDQVVDQSEPTNTDDTLTEDELFEILSNRRRRHILHQLIRERDTLDIGTLSKEIAAWEDGLELHEVSSSDRKRVYTALHQSHLPKMDKAGVIDFDRDRGTVEPTPALEDIEIYMAVVHGREIPWSNYYLGLTGLSGLLLVAASFSFGPFPLLSLSAWAVFVIVAFGISALVHYYYARQNRIEIATESRAPDLEFEYRESVNDR